MKLLKYLKTIIISTILFCSSSQLAFADTNQSSRDILNGLVSTQKMNEANKQFLSSRNKIEEIIDPQTGSLSYKQTDLVLPGKNGLDLSITRLYQSSSAEIGTKKIDIYNQEEVVCDSKTVYVIEVSIYVPLYGRKSIYQSYDSYSEAQAAIVKYNSRRGWFATYVGDSDVPTNCRTVTNKVTRNYVDNRTYLGKRYDLGTGWSLAFPSVQEEDGYLYFHDGTGAAYQVDFKLGDTNLVNYQGKDVQFQQDNATFNNGQSNSAYVFISSDQRKTYFSQDGRILGVKDRYGNELKFIYVDRNVGGHENKYISKIIDSIGRTVDFTYENSINSENFDGDDIIITVTDPSNPSHKTSIKYTKYRDFVNNQYHPFLWKVTHAVNTEEEQSFYYEYNNVESGFRFDTKSTTGSSTTLKLMKAAWAHNLKTSFTYETINRNLGNDGLYSAYRVNSRFDSKFKYINGYYHETNLNKILFSYQNDYSGYPETNNDFTLPTGYLYGSTATLETGMKIKSIYNSKRQLIHTEEIATNKERKVVSNLTFDNAFIYKPTRSEISYYADKELIRSLYVDRSYNEWGGIQTETLPLTLSQLNDENVKSKNTVSFQYHPTFKIITEKSWYQNENTLLKEVYSYDSLGRLSSFTNTNNEVTNYSYSKTADAELVEISKNLGNGKTAKTTQVYGKEGKYAFITQEKQGYTDTNNLYTESINSYKYDLLFGLLIKDTDHENRTTSYNYDQLGRVKSIVAPKYTNQSGEVYEVEYVVQYVPNRTPQGLDVENANLNTTMVWSHIQVKNLTKPSINYYENISQFYDGFGNLISKHIWDSDKGVWFEEVENRFDNQNRIVYSTNSNGDINTVEYDAWGDISVSKDPFGNLGKSTFNLKSNSRIDYFIAKENISLESSDEVKENVVETIYDTRGNITETIQYPYWPDKKEPLKREYTYDTVGNILSQKDGNGYITNFEYDKLNRLNAVINPLRERTEYHYDVFGNLNSVKQSDGTTIWETKKEYNELNNLASKTYPSSEKESYEFSTIGNLESKTDLNQNTHEYSYDGLNRLFTSQINNQKFKYYYQSNPFGPEKIEELNTDNNSVVGYDSYQYNYAGYIASHKTNTLGLVQQTSYTYDQLNRITGLLDQKGFATNYLYEKNRLSRVQTNGKQLESFQDSTSVNYEYFSDGKIKSLTYPPLSDGKKIKAVYTYDKLNRLDTVVNYIGTTIKSDFKYQYDFNDNITSITSSGSETQYVYDKVNRLKEIIRPNGSKITYSYDSRGNRTQLTGLDDIKFDETFYQYNELNQLEFIDNGGPITTYHYNTEGLRSIKSSDSKKLLYNYDQQGRVISESDGSNKTLANYVWGHDRVFAKLDKSGATEKQYYYLYNGHGDVIEILDSNGQTVNTYQYDEWGNITQQVEGVKNPFKYAGEVYDEESGLYYLRARYYDPTIGRFISKDTYEGIITNPLSLNQYTYVGNNPLIYVDPCGRMQLNQIDGLHNGIKKSGYDAVKDLINTPSALWQLMYGMIVGNISFSDIAKAMGSSIVGPIDYLIDNFKSVIVNPFATDKAVYNYGVQLGNVLQMIGGSATGGAAIKIISNAVPGLGKILSKAAKATGCKCFTAGTMVLTDEGEKPIEEIEVGDKVLAKDDETGEMAYKEVEWLFQRDVEETYNITVGGEVITTTDEHPFWIVGKGWMEAKNLVVGDVLTTSDGKELAIEKIEVKKEHKTVYNFMVKDYHTYFVSNLGIWTHNSCFNINVKPTVSNSKLQNVVNDLYKGQNMPDLIGNGTTMDAIRHELETGEPVGGKFHSQKGQEYSRALKKLINSGNLNEQDTAVAQALYDDLQKALVGK